MFDYRAMMVGLLIVCQAVFCPVYAQAKAIHLKTGNTLECTRFEIDENFLNLTVADGSMRIPKSSLSEESLKEFFPNDPLLQPKPDTPKEQKQVVWKSYRDTKPSGINTENQTVHPEPPKAEEPKPIVTIPSNLSPLEKALARAGENRPELEKALTQSNTPEMKQLMISAPPYDLVNITAEHLLNTVNYYLKVKAEMPWGDNKLDSGIEEKLWTEYVLPYRIADEDLDDWRKEFYETLSPLVASSKNTKEAALIAHKWLYKGNTGGTAFMTFTPESGEYRDVAPRQLLKIKNGKCFEMNMLMVALLRSIGIPSRFVVIPYWTGKMDLYHSWIEYWNDKDAKWEHFDANPDPNWLMANSQPYPVIYALPGFPTERDLCGREKWDLMENITGLYTKPAKLKVSAAGNTVNPICYTVYTFNYGTWRSVAQKTSTDRLGEVLFELSDNTNVYPYLVSAAVDGKLSWNTVKLIAGREQELLLQDRIEEQILEFPQKAKKK